MRPALAACALLFATGCFSVQSRAEWKAAKVEEGMPRDRVRKKLGEPIEKLPVPGQGADPRLPVEVWRYHQQFYTGMALTAVFTLGIGMIFMDTDPCYWDVGFDREGRVVKVSEVYRTRD